MKYCVLQLLFLKAHKMGPSFGFDHNNSKQLYSARHLISQKTVKRNHQLSFLCKDREENRVENEKFSIGCSFAWGSSERTLFFPTYNAEMNFIDFICSIFQFLLMPCRDASLPQTLSPRRLPGGRPFHFALPPRRCFSLCFSFFSLLLSVWHCLGF